MTLIKDENGQDILASTAKARAATLIEALAGSSARNTFGRITIARGRFVRQRALAEQKIAAPPPSMRCFQMDAGSGSAIPSYDAGALTLPNHTWHTRGDRINRSQRIHRSPRSHQSISSCPSSPRPPPPRRAPLRENSGDPMKRKAFTLLELLLANMLIRSSWARSCSCSLRSPEQKRMTAAPDQDPTNSILTSSAAIWQFRIRRLLPKQRGFILTGHAPRRQILTPTDRRARVIYESAAKRTCSV